MPYTARLLIRDVLSVPPEQTVAAVTALMKKANVDSVIVGNASKPQGIFTERDLARRVVAEGLDPAATAVGSVMTKEIVSVNATEPLDRVFECLAGGKFRHLPITDRGAVVGLVSLTDLAQVLREVYREEKYIQYFAEAMQVK